MEKNGTFVRKIEKMADFQMRKATHIRCLENCLAENVIPKGLRLEKQMMVGGNSNLQETVDKALQKFSLELVRLVCDDHSHQLNESKGKMLELEGDLKKHLNDERKFNNISSEIFSKTETNKNKIVEKQQKKLEKLINARGCYIVGVTKAGSTPRTDSQEGNQSSSDPKTSAGHETELVKPRQSIK